MSTEQARDALSLTLEGLHVGADDIATTLDALLASHDALVVLVDWHELGLRASTAALETALRGAQEARKAEHFTSTYGLDIAHCSGWLIAQGEEEDRD